MHTRISQLVGAHSPKAASLKRARAVLGIPSALVLASLLFSQSVLEILIPHLGGWQGELIWLGLLALGVLFYYRKWEQSFEHSVSTTQLGCDGAAKLAERRGLVVLIGLSSDDPNSPVAKLLAGARDVSYIALVGTPQTEARNVADGVRKLIKAAGLQLEASHVRTFEDDNNASSLADFERATGEAVAWMRRQGLAREEIVVDVTEGRRPMGFGALIAAEGAGVEAQYLAYEWDHLENAPILTKPMFKVVRSMYSDEVVAEAH